MLVVTTALCHDGSGGMVFLLRGSASRDEVGKWCIVTGALEDGLTAEENVRKEIREEIGVEALSLRFLGYRDLVATGQLALDFTALIPVAGVHNAEPHKHDELRWATRHSIPYPGHRWLTPYLDKYRDEIAREVYKLTWLLAILPVRKRVRGCSMSLRLPSDRSKKSVACLGCGRPTQSRHGYCNRTEACRKARARVRQRGRYRGSEDRGGVYVIGCDEFRPVKIGFTRYSVTERMMRLQTGCPYEFKLLAFFPCGREIEKLLHEVLEDYHVRGEWFEIPEGDPAGEVQAICMSLIGESGVLDFRPPSTPLLHRIFYRNSGFAPAL